MTDERKEPWVERWAASYHEPPPVPREEMWREVEARLPVGRADGVVPLRPRRSRWAPALGWAAAAAAVLAVGIGIGRWSTPADPVGAPGGGFPAVAGGAAPGTGSGAGAYRVAAAEHLGRTESLLAVLRADARRGSSDPEVARWGRSLLLETRLLLDSPAASDPAMQALLEDLELILVQVAGLPTSEDRRREELEWITQGMEARDVLPRIRAATPLPGSPISD